MIFPLPVTVKTGRRSRGRREARILLLRIGSKWKLILRAAKVGPARWVQELSVVAEGEEEVEGGNTELDEEGNNARPSVSTPGAVAPYTRKANLNGEYGHLSKEAHNLLHQPDQEWYL